MTAHILVVDDEPDVEALILQKFRHKIRQRKQGFSEFLKFRSHVQLILF